MTQKSAFDRRSVLRGAMGGAAISVGLPLLDCFLNTNGTAFASGAPLPVCFGTWFQGLGFNPGFWEPKTAGKNYEMGLQFQPLTPLKNKINVFSGMKVFVNGAIPVHTGGQTVGFSGGYPKPGEPALPSIDTLVADVIGTRTRFRSLEVSCDGTPTSNSRRRGNIVNPAEFSPIALYNRIFGPEFKDPNAADFTPDTKVIVRRSALSAVSDERQSFLATLGPADRARLDEYFTSLRETEHQLDLMMQKPAPLESCAVPEKVTKESTPGLVIDDVLANHKIFAMLLTHALACGQTQIFNLNLAGALSQTRRADSSDTFHTLTHEENIDPKLGYQRQVGWFQDQVVKALFSFAKTLDDFKEGDHTLLDRTLVLYTTDHGLAKVHGNENVPMMTIGSGAGRIKTGMHLPANGDTMARVGLTVQQALGVSVSSWGTEGNQTSHLFSEILA